MILTAEDFDEATLFERLALDRVRPVLGDESTDEIDLRSVLVKKSDRLLFVSFWFARQSVSGLFLLPASTVGASFG